MFFDSVPKPRFQNRHGNLFPPIPGESLLVRATLGFPGGGAEIRKQAAAHPMLSAGCCWPLLLLRGSCTHPAAIIMHLQQASSCTCAHAHPAAIVMHIQQPSSCTCAHAHPAAIITHVQQPPSCTCTHAHPAAIIVHIQQPSYHRQGKNLIAMVMRMCITMVRFLPCG